MRAQSSRCCGRRAVVARPSRGGCGSRAPRPRLAPTLPLDACTCSRPARRANRAASHTSGPDAIATTRAGRERIAALAELFEAAPEHPRAGRGSGELSGLSTARLHDDSSSETHGRRKRCVRLGKQRGRSGQRERCTPCRARARESRRSRRELVTRRSRRSTVRIALGYVRVQRSPVTVSALARSLESLPNGARVVRATELVATRTCRRTLAHPSRRSRAAPERSSANSMTATAGGTSHVDRTSYAQQARRPQPTPPARALFTAPVASRLGGGCTTHSRRSEPVARSHPPRAGTPGLSKPSDTSCAFGALDCNRRPKGPSKAGGDSRCCEPRSRRAAPLTGTTCPRSPASRLSLR